MDSGAVAVEQDLDLHVPRTGQVALENEPIVSEGPTRLAPRSGESVAQLVHAAHQAHSLAATTGAGLDEQREADALRLRGERLVVLLRPS